jgi:hypothetical protein
MSITEKKQEGHKMSITLRSRKLRDGRRPLFLDCYEQGKRDFVFLELYLSRDRAVNKAVMEIAAKVRLQRELEAASGRLGGVIFRCCGNSLS